MRAAALGIRFLCEVAAVVGYVWLGWPWLGLVVGAAVVVFWGAYVAPKSPRRLRDPLRLGAELVVFAGAAAAFAEVGQGLVAIVFAILAVGTAALVRVWPEP